MNGKKVLYYAAIAIALLFVVGIAVSVLLSILALLRLAVYGVVLIGLAYGLYKAGSWLLGGNDDTYATDSIGSPRSSSSSSSSSTATDGPQDRQDRLRQQYVDGQIGEAEFEERIARELETEDLDDIERELERER